MGNEALDLEGETVQSVDTSQPPSVRTRSLSCSEEAAMAPADRPGKDGPELASQGLPPGPKTAHSLHHNQHQRLLGTPFHSLLARMEAQALVGAPGLWPAMFGRVQDGL